MGGLFLEGCGWDSASKQLCESTPKVLFVEAPCMWLVPKPTDKFNEFVHYSCPVYRWAPGFMRGWLCKRPEGGWLTGYTRGLKVGGYTRGLKVGGYTRGLKVGPRVHAGVDVPECAKKAQENLGRSAKGLGTSPPPSPSTHTQST